MNASHTESGNDTHWRPFGKPMLIIAALSVAYLTFIHFSAGLKIEHITLVGLYNVGLVAHPASRKLMAALTVFLIFGILYDGLRIWPNYLFNDVDFEGIYQLEKSLFGISWHDSLLTPNEYFRAVNSTVLDLVTGLVYLNWISVPLAFGIYAYVTDKQNYLHYALVFLLANLLGFCLYYLHPTAPPWYVDIHGFTLQRGVTSHAAGLLRFDRLVDCDIFRTLYTRNSNVFAAVPSLHSAYPVVVFFYALRTVRSLPMKTFFALFMVGIWFSAVYTDHHYVIDVVLGVGCAVVAIALFHTVLLRIPAIRRALRRYESVIS